MIDARNQEIFNTFKKFYTKPYCYDFNKAIIATAHCEASRFWVSEERATVVIAAMIANKNVSYLPYGDNRQRKEMFDEIFKRVIDMFADRKKPAVSIRDIVEEVVNQPAPSFYLSERTIKDIVINLFNRK